MNDNYDKIEENLKKKARKKKEQKISGKSVFKLQEIIQQKAVSSEVERKEKSKKDINQENSSQNITS